MNKKRVWLNLIISFFLYISIGCIILNYCNDAAFTNYYTEYWVLTISYFLVAAIFFGVIFKKRISIFEPFILISVLYMCLFTFTPIIFILIGKTDAHGIDVMNGCIKATWIYIFSYIAFVIGYVGYKVKYKKSTKSYINDRSLNKVEVKNKNKVLIISYLIWIVAYIITVIYLLTTGKNLFQIVMFGKGVSEGIDNSGSLLGFLSNFSYCMIIPYIYIYIIEKNKLIKFLIGYLTLSAYVIRGFRFIIIIMIGALVITYYGKNKKKPKVSTCIVGILSLLIFIGGLGYARNSIRTGEKINWASFDVNDITYALESNFDIYKTFYGIVDHYPKEYSYSFGKSMIGETITMFIPRVFWPKKPLAVDASVVLAIRRSVSEFAINNAAMATPNIGEYYVDFGISGCLILMFLLGVVAKWTTKLYYGINYDIHDIILYSVITPSFLQIIIRGYTPSNFYLILFLLAPSFIIRLNDCEKGRKSNK